jgi:tetratricopeptide (TPR) repeat protein
MDGCMVKIFRDLSFSWLTYGFLLAGVLLMLGCASVKYKEVKELYDNGDFEQVIQSSMDCSDFSANCFHIKLLQADSHYQLGNLGKALKYSQEALARQDKVNDLKTINQLHLLRARIIFELLPEVQEAPSKLQVLDQLETQLKQTLEWNAGSSRDSLLLSQRQELMQWLGETFLAEMDLTNEENLGSFLQEIEEWTKKFPAKMQSEGYAKYYLLQGELKSILPQVKSWGSRGNALGGREQLLEKLKSIYLEAINLRRLPLYEDGYGEKIDLFLSQLDQYMKGMVL